MTFTHLREYKEMTKQTQDQKQQDINSMIHTANGSKLNLRSKTLFVSRQLLLTASVVLLRLIVNTSRQC